MLVAYKCPRAGLSQAMTDNKLSVPVRDTEREHFVRSGTKRENMAARLQCGGWVISQARQTYLWAYIYTNKLGVVTHRMCKVQMGKAVRARLQPVPAACHKAVS